MSLLFDSKFVSYPLAQTANGVVLYVYMHQNWPYLVSVFNSYANPCESAPTAAGLVRAFQRNCSSLVLLIINASDLFLVLVRIEA